MAPMLVCQAQFASAAYFRDGVDGGVGFRANGGEDVLEGEVFGRGEAGGVGPVHGRFLVFLHVGRFGSGVDEDGLRGGG